VAGMHPQVEQFQCLGGKTPGELHPLILADVATPD
jgi:hypothetical protein